MLLLWRMHRPFEKKPVVFAIWQFHYVLGVAIQILVSIQAFYALWLLPTPDHLLFGGLVVGLYRLRRLLANSLRFGLRPLIVKFLYRGLAAGQNRKSVASRSTFSHSVLRNKLIF